MKSEYCIARDTLAFLRELYRHSREEHPECQIGFGWGGDSTGRKGVNCGLYHDTNQPMPPIYSFDDMTVHFAFPSNIPETLKSGVVCFRNNEFVILPVSDFARDDLVEGVLAQIQE